MNKELHLHQAEALFDRLPSPTHREKAILAAAGVKYQTSDPKYRIKAGYVVFNGTRFEFEGPVGTRPIGRRALIVRDRPLFSFTTGLVAYELATGRLASWRGEVSLLREKSEYSFSDQIEVHDSFLSWLRSDRNGFLVVDPANAGRRIFREALSRGGEASLLVKDERQARDIRRKIKAFVPSVRVQRDEAEAA